MYTVRNYKYEYVYYYLDKAKIVFDTKRNASNPKPVIPCQIRPDEKYTCLVVLRTSLGEGKNKSFTSEVK